MADELPHPFAQDVLVTSRSRPACATAAPRSFTRRTASISISRLNLRICIAHLRLHKTGKLGVHETGSRPNSTSARLLEPISPSKICLKLHVLGKCRSPIRLTPHYLASRQSVLRTRLSVSLEFASTPAILRARPSIITRCETYRALLPFVRLSVIAHIDYDGLAHTFMPPLFLEAV